MNNYNKRPLKETKINYSEEILNKKKFNWFNRKEKLG